MYCWRSATKYSVAVVHTAKLKSTKAQDCKETGYCSHHFRPYYRDLATERPVGARNGATCIMRCACRGCPCIVARRTPLASGARADCFVGSIRCFCNGYFISTSFRMYSCRRLFPTSVPTRHLFWTSCTRSLQFSDFPPPGVSKGFMTMVPR